MGDQLDLEHQQQSALLPSHLPVHMGSQFIPCYKGTSYARMSRKVRLFPLASNNDRFRQIEMQSRSSVSNIMRHYDITPNGTHVVCGFVIPSAVLIQPVQSPLLSGFNMKQLLIYKCYVLMGYQSHYFYQRIIRRHFRSFQFLFVINNAAIPLMHRRKPASVKDSCRLFATVCERDANQGRSLQEIGSPEYLLLVNTLLE